MHFPRTRHHHLQLPALVAVLLAALLLIPPAHAAPISVRAKTTVEVSHKRTGKGLELHCRLLDDVGRPIPNESVTFEVDGHPLETPVTDADGRFELRIDRASLVALERRHGNLLPWTLRFAGTRELGETVATGRIDLTRTPTRLTLALEDGKLPVIALDRNPVTLTVTLNDGSESSPIRGAEILLSVGTGRELLGTTGASGDVSFILRPELLEGGGDYPITARFPGSVVHAPSDATLTLTVLRPTRLTLRVVREGTGEHARYRMSGRLSDERAPLPHQVVTLLVTAPTTEAPILTLAASTNADGLFVTAIDERDLQALKLPRLTFRASFNPPALSLAPSESESATLDVPAPRGIPLRWYLIPLGALALAYAFSLAYRNGTHRRLLAALRARQEEPSPTPTDAPPPTAPGLITGLVTARDERRPLVALIRARTDTGIFETTSDARGQFTLGPLPPSSIALEALAEGHLPLSLTLPSPRAVDLRLVSVRAELRSLFLRALATLGSRARWGYDTPRESSAHTSNPPPLTTLTELVEASHFGPSSPPLEAVEQARSALSDLSASSREA